MRKFLTAWILVGALLAPAAASARGGKRHKPTSEYDESKDFSKHFDEEVKDGKQNPADEDGNAAPKKKKSHHKKKSHAEPPPSETSAS